MDPTHVYAIATSGTALIIFLKNLLPYLGRLKVYLEYLGTKYLKYPYLLNRHAQVGPWTVRNALLLGCYLMINIFCVVFRADLVESGHRAGRLALINLGPLYSGFHLAFLADIFGLTLKACKAVHKTAGLIAFLLAAAHVLIEAATATFAFRKNLLHPWVIIAGSTLCALMILSRRIFHRPSYEVFLRSHQGLALLCLCAIWYHVRKAKLFPRLCLYSFAAIFGVTFVLEAITVWLRNELLQNRRAEATVSSSCGMVKLRLRLSAPLKVEPGQYLNLWMPSVSLSACLQSHPFVVTSWADTQQTTLDFFIQPRRGFTRDLLYLARRSTQTKTSWVTFSGPHGRPVQVEKYEKVFLMADGAGIATQLPFLKKLIHLYQARRAFTRKIHLVWQINDIDVGIAAQPFLNEALADDKLGDGGILQISIYVNLDDISQVSFGTRSTVFPGTADLQRLVKDEMSASYDGLKDMAQLHPASSGLAGPAPRKEAQENGQIQGVGYRGSNVLKSYTSRQSASSHYSTDALTVYDNSKSGLQSERTMKGTNWQESQALDLENTKPHGMLILASVYGKNRDALRTVTTELLDHGVTLVETDFQPFRR